MVRARDDLAVFDAGIWLASRSRRADSVNPADGCGGSVDRAVGNVGFVVRTGSLAADDCGLKLHRKGRSAPLRLLVRSLHLVTKTCRSGSKDMNQSGSRRLKVLLAGVALAAPAVSFAEGLIPWPWLQSNRYRSWKQERDQQKAAWYAERSNDPVGARQYYYKGKEWPPYPRPQGLSQVPTHIYHAAHYWPYPYVCEDREIVRQMDLAQEEAGWVSETTLYDYHFEPDAQQLNKSGVLHVRWILENAPVHRRTVYVQAADNNVSSQLRLANVQAELTELVPSGSVPPVILRVTRTLGRPADEVDKIQRSDINTLPAPRISPAITTQSGNSGSGANSGGGSTSK